MTPKELYAATKATAGTIIFIVAAALATELSAPFKTILTSTFGHHWIGKSILSLVVFGALYYFFAQHSSGKNVPSPWTMAKHATIIAILGGIIIFGFFVKEFLG